MDEKNLRHLLFSLKVSVQRATYTGSSKNTRWINISCPFAQWTHAKGSDNNPSFGITLVEDGRSHYKCLACGTKGRVSSLPTRLGGYRGENQSKLRHWAELTEMQIAISRPTIDWEASKGIDEDEHAERTSKPLPSHDLVNGYPRALGLRYLRKRGIIWPTPLTLNLRYDDYQHRILFPCYDPLGRFRGFTGRSTLPASRLSKRNPKVRDYHGLDKRQLFLGLRGQYSGPTVITEGLFDYAAGVQAGFKNSKAILGTALTDEKVDILINAGNPVYFFMDNDRAGWNSLFGIFDKDGQLEKDNAWAYRLYQEIPVWIVPYPNPFDNLDPGSMSTETFRNHVKRAWLFTGQAPLDDMEEPHLLPLGGI